MSKKFVVMPSFPENQINILPGRNEFETTTGVSVEYYYNVVNGTLELTFPGNSYPGSLSTELNYGDISEVIDFLVAIRNHIDEVHC